jgi:hypothetical protein
MADCKHDLKYCEHCDCVFCKKCKQEWGRKEYVYVPTTYPTWIPNWLDNPWTTATNWITNITTPVAHKHD